MTQDHILAISNQALPIKDFLGLFDRVFGQNKYGKFYTFLFFF